MKSNILIVRNENSFTILVDGQQLSTNEDFGTIISDLTNYAYDHKLIETDDRVELLHDLRILKENVDECEKVALSLLKENEKLKEENKKLNEALVGAVREKSRYRFFYSLFIEENEIKKTKLERALKEARKYKTLYELYKNDYEMRKKVGDVEKKEEEILNS